MEKGVASGEAEFVRREEERENGGMGKVERGRGKRGLGGILAEKEDATTRHR